MVLDERLTWTGHANDIVKRFNFRLKHLSTFRCVLNQDVKKGLVDVLVQPIFDYGDVVYFNTSRRNKERIQRDNKCVRFFAGIRRRQHISSFREGMGYVRPGSLTICILDLFSFRMCTLIELVTLIYSWSLCMCRVSWPHRLLSLPLGFRTSLTHYFVTLWMLKYLRKMWAFGYLFGSTISLVVHLIGAWIPFEVWYKLNFIMIFINK
jgi:hypothetical protein